MGRFRRRNTRIKASTRAPAPMSSPVEFVRLDAKPVSPRRTARALP